MGFNKNLNIETLRGIAIMLVVVGHVIGSGPTGGMQVEQGSVYRYLYCLMENLRMPLFTVISGWVYALHPVEVGSGWSFIVNKMRRLLLPMIFVGTLYFMLQYLTPGTNHKEALSSIWRIYVYPYTLFWYLPALFLVFCAMIWVEAVSLLSTIERWSVAMVLALGLCLCELSHIIPVELPNLFAFKNALYLLPFFILGVGLNRFADVLCSAKFRNIYLVATILGIVVQQINYFTGQFSFYQMLHIAVPIGLVWSAYLMSIKLQFKLFIKLAAYAYTIYLFHGFGTAGGRILLSYVGITNQLAVFVFATVLAILIPIVVDKVLAKNRYTGLLFLGKRFR